LRVNFIARLPALLVMNVATSLPSTTSLKLEDGARFSTSTSISCFKLVPTFSISISASPLALVPALASLASLFENVPAQDDVAAAGPDLDVLRRGEVDSRGKRLHDSRGIGGATRDEESQDDERDCKH
jgi:hypothetical protein